MQHFNSQCDYITLAKQYGTPLYIYDIDSIQTQYFNIKNSFGGFKSLVCYALKANSNLSVVKSLAHCGSGADCVSLNEVKRALLAGIPSYKIIFSGVGKEDHEILEAIKLGVLFINVESEMELLRIEQITKEIYGDKILKKQYKKQHIPKTITDPLNQKMPKDMQYRTRISIRVNPDIYAKTHPYISTGLRENKFGLDIENAKKLYLYAHKSDFLNPIGIHYHIGSQILEIDPLLESTQKILELAKNLKAVDIPLKFFDIGGGFGIQYKDNETIFNIQHYISQIIRKIDALDLTAICEPGRFIVGNSGVLLTRVIGEKTTYNKRFVIVDCAMNDLLRPSLYHAYHHISYLKNDNNKQATKCDVVGAICESGDYIGKDVILPHCESGDLLLIHSAGAYGYSMASNYNSRMRPAEVALYRGETFLIKERENFDESVKNELAHIHTFLP